MEKKFKSIGRAMRRGNLTTKFESSTNTLFLMRKSTQGNPVVYTYFNLSK